MKLAKPQADLFIPDGVGEAEALSRTTHLCVGAHQDDIEIMAYHGIAECYGRTDRWMTGVTVTDGAGSSRTGLYASFTDEEMQQIRAQEQRKAAYVGEYAAQFQLGYSSAEVKDPEDDRVVNDLARIFEATRPEVVYLHNPADKHDTHVAVLLRCLTALRSLPMSQRPSRAYGCEVWRSLDWMPDAHKQILPVSSYPNLASALVSLFDSQISGGKRYDLATEGRRLANATYFDSHATDQETALTYAVDLTPLIQDDSLSLADYTLRFIDDFRADVEGRIKKFAGQALST
ncbi:MAG TPA: PIG-L family deacetylase [Acidobacteriota bacterium]|nr:PIG-L family deacetylase [Acidobacteriota bacterium]